MDQYWTKDLNTAIASIGHRDVLIVCDAGYPIPSNARRIDRAKLGTSPTSRRCSVIAEDLIVEEAIYAKEMEGHNPRLLDKVKRNLGKRPLHHPPHSDAERHGAQAKAIPGKTLR